MELPSLNNFIFKKILREECDQYVVLGEFEGKKSLLFIPLDFDIHSKKDKFKQLKVKETNSSGTKENCSYRVEDTREIIITSMHNAEQSEIDKYTSVNYKITRETGKEYKEIVLPYLKKTHAFSVEWIEKILKKPQDFSDLILLSNDVYILKKNWNWKQESNIRDLSCLVLFHDPKLTSLRDLTTKHVGMLKKMRKEVYNHLTKKYSIEREDLRVYFHYHPTYFRLHLHVTHLHNFKGSVCERARNLDDVIDMIEMKPDFYQVATLTTQFPERSMIYRLLKENKQREGM